MLYPFCWSLFSIERNKNEASTNEPRIRNPSFSAFAYEEKRPWRPCCCERYIITVVNTSTGFNLRVSKIQCAKKQHISERKTHETKMPDFDLRVARETRIDISDLCNYSRVHKRGLSDDFRSDFSLL